MGIIDKLKNGEILISDGAMGTFLFEKGLKTGECPEQWNVSNADKVKEIIQSYINAGSDIVETNSFGGSRYKLKNFSLENNTKEFNEKAAAIAKEAAGDKYVAGSVGPTGKFVKPLGDVTEEELYEVFKEQITALVSGGADMICIETMMDLKEAIIALKAAKENTDLPVIVTFTYSKTNDGYKTMMGVSPEVAASEIDKAGADIIGSNCGNGIENMIEITSELRKNSDKYIMIQPNAGMPVLENGETVYKESPEKMASLVKRLIEAGANIIGGCCGTTPAHITAIKEAVKA